MNHLRESWLMEAVEQLKPIFERMGYQVPPVKVSVGFTSSGSKGRHLGQCWSTKSSEDEVNQIFIAPHLPTAIEVLDTLVHELVHAVDDCQSGHGENFKRIAKDIGLKGPMRSAGAGELLMKDLVKISSLLGNFPHGRLNIPRAASNAGIKRPGAICSKCGYEIVMLKRCLDVGPPLCPKNHGVMDQTGDWE
jgi:SprT-like family